MSKILYFPDIHGRSFWKEPAKNIDEYDKVVFNGDYMDPYPFEKIGYPGALENFKEIIEFKKANPDKVVLLLGNHDLHYMNKISKGSRFDMVHHWEIDKIFHDNDNLFNLCYSAESGDKKILFTHAGVHYNWIEYFLEDGDDIAETINRLYKENNYTFIDALDEVSTYRGGWQHEGSLVWADICEFLKEPNTIDYYQVVGHTYVSKPIVLDNICCLDVQRGFIIEDGEIKELDGTVLTKSC